MMSFRRSKLNTAAFKQNLLPASHYSEHYVANYFQGNLEVTLNDQGGMTSHFT